MFGTMGDDSFMDMRNWFISHGREAYEKVLRDPDSLVTLAWDAQKELVEQLGGAAYAVYHEKTKRRMPRPAPGIDSPTGMQTDPSDDTATTARFPQLSRSLAGHLMRPAAEVLDDSE